LYEYKHPKEDAFSKEKLTIFDYSYQCLLYLHM
jgi:hypothetical protein